MESKVACYLQLLKDSGYIKDWAYEEKRFEFPDDSWLIDFTVTETEDDIESIANLAEKILLKGRESGIRPEINLSVSIFVPKSHTPFQWVSMEKEQELLKKFKIIKNTLRSRWINFKYHSSELSLLEGVLARGDAKIGKVIEAAWKKGARFDGWSEFDNLPYWDSAFEETGIKQDDYIYTEYSKDAKLPWDHIDTGVKKQYLLDGVQLWLNT